MKSLKFFGCAVLLTVACGRAAPQPVKTADGHRGFELAYCLNDTDCYQDAAKVCPDGYQVVDWAGAKPKVVVCDS